VLSSRRLHNESHFVALLRLTRAGLVGGVRAFLASARCSASSRSRRTTCAGRQQPWRGDLGFDDAWIAKCLDHAASKKSEQIVPSVTGKVYNHSKRMKEKRAVLDGVAAELRRIIGKGTEIGLRLAA
jgi:hypothetical protein